ncbi:hypothetical protein BuS5_01853 [Desulfosarcina sp. BuS5]|uniref:metal-dependent hydrolase n=1 Tax=Desulfosarcina sp. BuS5 TaxID=933262 RepID=UPI000487EC68|nr:metal-dependent hydrolase [Desulfosarcina sp. BuS5]WDN88885.1 hypothetical protein BuS5_01853 [Desulfosarcina sp. BuS5]
MAQFKTHLAGGMVAGAGVSVLGLFTYGLNLTQACAVFVIGSVGGVLPDLDSDSGKPLSLLFELISVLIPALLFMSFVRQEWISPEFLVCYFTFSYLFINYVACTVIKRLTVHRGIMHSVPFALFCGGIGYLLFASSGKVIATIAGLAVLAGCLTHLVLDELNSFTLKFGFIPWLKRSSGTALKLKSNSLATNLLVYCLIIIVAIAIFFVS